MPMLQAPGHYKDKPREQLHRQNKTDLKVGNAFGKVHVHHPTAWVLLTDRRALNASLGSREVILSPSETH